MRRVDNDCSFIFPLYAVISASINAAIHTWLSENEFINYTQLTPQLESVKIVTVTDQHPACYVPPLEWLTG